VSFKPNTPPPWRRLQSLQKDLELQRHAAAALLKDPEALEKYMHHDATAPMQLHPQQLAVERSPAKQQQQETAAAATASGSRTATPQKRSSSVTEPSTAAHTPQTTTAPAARRRSVTLTGALEAEAPATAASPAAARERLQPEESTEATRLQELANENSSPVPMMMDARSAPTTTTPIAPKRHAHSQNHHKVNPEELRREIYDLERLNPIDDAEYDTSNDGGAASLHHGPAASAGGTLRDMNRLERRGGGRFPGGVSRHGVAAQQSAQRPPLHGRRRGHRQRRGHGYWSDDDDQRSDDANAPRRPSRDRH
jgi:hypothetical protein